MSRKRSQSQSKKAAEETNPDFNLVSVGNYNIIKTLGEGNFAKVKLAKHKLTGQEVAIKVIDKTQLDEKKLSKLYREVRVMKTLHHPHIIRLYEVVETKYTVFLVMEYSNGGELYDYLVVHGRMKEKEARIKFRQILSAVSYCHNKRVIHRDLKAENLLLDKNLDVKIADFGFTNTFDPEGKLDTFCGSPPYAAPELFQGRKYTGPEVDVWSLGVILYVMTTGCLPFDGKNLQEMRESVCKGKYRIPFYLTEGCERCLRKFLVRDSTKRETLEIVADDPWLNEGFVDSAITKDISISMKEDTDLVDLVCKKHNLDRNALVESIRANLYNDQSAIYYLSLYERMDKADTESKNSGYVPPLNRTLEDAKREQTPPKTPVETKGGLIKIEEDEPLEATIPSAAIHTAAIPSAKGRQRRYTVNSVEPPATQDQPKRLSPLATIPPIEKPSNAGNDVSAEKKVVEKPQQPQEMKPSTPVLEPISSTSPTSTEPVPPQRKRTNTITGILRTITRRNDEEPRIRTSVDSTASSVVDPNDTSKPRSLRFTFNSSTTSSKQPDEIVQEVIAVCNVLLVAHKLTSRFMIDCIHSEGVSNPVHFEVEVCKLPRLNNMHGLKFKRLSGSSSEYKNICEEFLTKIKL